MISLFGTTLSSVSPWMLTFAPIAVGLLVYIFRVRGDSRSVVVSTLWLLRELPQRPLGRRLFVPPPQFWIELALFMSVILAAAHIVSIKRGEHVAVLFDTSLSMNAATSNGTRLEQMKSRAVKDISQAPSSTLFTLYSTSGSLSQSLPKLDGGDEAAKAINHLSPSFATDAIQELLQTLLADSSFDKVWVYTDHEVQQKDPTSRLVISSPIDGAQSPRNVWIHALARSGLNQSSVTVSLKSSGAKRTDATLTAECYQQGRSLQIPAISAQILPNEITTVSVEPLPREWEYCHVRLSTPASQETEHLLLDNDGWIVRNQALTQVDLISALPPAQLGLSAIPFITVSSITTQTPSTHAAIIHRQSFTTSTDAPTLMVFPPVGNLPWGGRVYESKAQTISRWDEAHPIMRYVKPSLLSLSEARTLDCPKTAKPILFSELGAVMCAGEERGSRYVISGVELFPFEGNKSPTLSILLLNTLTWVFTANGASASNSIPTTILLPQNATDLSFVAPSQEPVQISPLHTAAIEHPGVVRISNPIDPPALMAFNSFSDYESALSPQPVELSTTPLRANAPIHSKERERDISPWFVTIALGVALFDIIRRAFQKRGWGSA